jgi:cell division protein ZapB
MAEPISPHLIIDRINQLLVLHAELQRTNALLSKQMKEVESERDTLRSKLFAARSRIDTLINRLHIEDAVPDATHHSKA